MPPRAGKKSRYWGTAVRLRPRDFGTGFSPGESVGERTDHQHFIERFLERGRAGERGAVPGILQESFGGAGAGADLRRAGAPDAPHGSAELVSQVSGPSA